MSREIEESCHELAMEQTQVRRVFGREKEQRSTLNHLGLSEVEAVEYVLMLSRDEEENRRQGSVDASSSVPHSVGDDEQLFFGDLDELQTPLSASIAAFRANVSSSSRLTSPRVSPSVSNNKVEVSPRLLPEPMEAGFSPGSSLSSSFGRNMHHIGAMTLPPLVDTQHFPAMSPGQPSPPSGASTPGSSAISRRSVSGSPESYRSAWSTPMRATQSMSSVLSLPLASSPTAASSGVIAGPSVLPSGIARQLDRMSVSSGPSGKDSQTKREEEELRFAIELSLAEARSRGESV